MKIYHYSQETGEFFRASDARQDPLETKKAGKPVYLLPAHATFDAPPTPGAKQAAAYRDGAWSLVDDYRGESYWHQATGREVVIRDLGPVDYNLVANHPPSGMHQPRWNGSQWIETALAYNGVAVASKADVDRVTRQRISGLGEERAKTEKLLAGAEKCASWDAFIAARAVILQEAEAFVEKNKLA